MPYENRKRSFYFKVTENNSILVQIHVCPDLQKTKTSQYQWFNDRHLLKLMEKINDISLARVLSGCTRHGQVLKDINEIISDPISSDFHMQYTFKRREMKQFVVTPSNMNKEDKECVHNYKYSGGGHKEFYLFPEKLVVFVSMEPLVPKENNLMMAKSCHGDVQAMKTSKEKSKYFKKETETSLTSSAVKKQANLRSIVSKMRGASDKNASATDDSHVITIAPGICKDNKQDTNKDTNIKPVKLTSVIDGPMTQGCSQKRSHQEACQREVTGSDTQSDGQNSDLAQENDEKYFVSSKSLSRKKRQKNTNKETMNNVSKLCPKNGSKYSQSVNSTSNRTKLSSGIKSVQAISESRVVDTQSKSKEESCENTEHIDSKTLPQAVAEPDIVLDIEDMVFEGQEYKTSSQEVEDMVVEGQEYQTSSQEVEDMVVEGQEYQTSSQEVEDVIVEGQEYNTITINDAIPNFENIKEIADLTADHIEYLVLKLQRKLKNIFKGKEYCRRQEDYKRGGQCKGDLAFQVRFGLYSEDQQDAIMKALMTMFCSRHNKYLDYLTKVLLPECFVYIYMELFGGYHDDVERILMRSDKRNVTQTDGSSTE